MYLACFYNFDILILELFRQCGTFCFSFLFLLIYNVNVVILLDLKKAFDVVDHDIMAKKLEIKALALFNS